MDRVKGHYDSVAVGADAVRRLACKFDHHSGHTALERSNANRTHRFEIDADRCLLHLDVSARAIQDQTIWIV
jgi:hypothetical protein